MPNQTKPRSKPQDANERPPLDTVTGVCYHQATDADRQTTYTLELHYRATFQAGCAIACLDELHIDHALVTAVEDSSIVPSAAVVLVVPRRGEPAFDHDGGLLAASLVLRGVAPVGELRDACSRDAERRWSRQQRGPE